MPGVLTTGVAVLDALPATGSTLPVVTAVCGLAILVGLVGIVLPVLPGTLLILASILIWAIVAGTGSGWVVLGVAAGIAALVWLLQYLIPGRRMRQAGVPTRSILLGALLGVVGFFVIPLIGLPLGFVGGVFLAELARLKTTEAAWPSTLHAVRAALVSYGIELCGGLAIATVWGFTAWRVLSA